MYTFNDLMVDTLIRSSLSNESIVKESTNDNVGRSSLKDEDTPTVTFNIAPDVTSRQRDHLLGDLPVNDDVSVEGDSVRVNMGLIVNSDVRRTDTGLPGIYLDEPTKDIKVNIITKDTKYKDINKDEINYLIDSDVENEEYNIVSSMESLKNKVLELI